MLQQEEQKELIEKFVKANAYYKGNEDLLEDFCKEVYQKAYLILSTSENIQKTELFITKIVNTTIISILKRNQRYEKVKAEEISNNARLAEAEEKAKSAAKIIDSGDGYIEYDYMDPINITDKIIIKESLLQNITDTVCIIHRELPHKLLYDIFYMRYLKKKTQNEISQELNLPQAEICKRLMHLSKLICAYLYKN